MSCPVPQMEIIDEDDEEIKELMRRIARKEITLCEDCDTFFPYIPQRKRCDECTRKHKAEYMRKRRSTPEYKAWRKAYDSRPENLEKKRLYDKEYRRKNGPRVLTAAQKKAKAKRMRLWHQKRKKKKQEEE